jgi:hypothetical protein
MTYHETSTAGPLEIRQEAGASREILEMAGRLEGYDMSFVTDKLVDDGGIVREDVQAATTEFKKFMVLAGMDIKPLAMIGPVVDEVWHQFILFTSHYREFCEKTVGRFIGHQPDTVLTPIPLEAGQNFLRAYKKFFGDLPTIWFRGMDERTISYYSSAVRSGPPPMRWSGWTGKD